VLRLHPAEKADHSVSLLCRLLGVSRSGFHAWERRPPSERALHDVWLVERIRAIHALSRERCGSPRLQAELRRRGVRVGRRRAERLMRTAGASGSRRRRKGGTTIGVRGVRVAGDLVERAFVAGAPNRLWMSHSKEIPTWEGKLYLATVIDCFSRRVVGWSMREQMRAELVVEALELAIGRRRPAGGVIARSDQGSHYVPLAFGQRCRQSGIAQSMGSKGDCYDNAVCESFHASLEKDPLRRRPMRSRQEARTAILEYIEVFFNRERLHSTLGYRSPAEFENDHERSDQADGTDQEILIGEQARAACRLRVHQSGGSPGSYLAEGMSPEGRA
jgi:putative transposase